MHNTEHNKNSILYTHPNCSSCNYIKDYLNSINFEFNEVDCSKNLQVCIKKNITSLPTLEVNGKFIVGKKAIINYMSKISKIS